MNSRLYQQRLADYFPDLSQKQEKQFKILATLHKQWHQKINLISTNSLQNIYTEHFLHSLFIIKKHNFLQNETVLDLGTGGGFPGIPLAIACPNTYFVLCDSIRKKIQAVTAFIQELRITNVQPIHKRAEHITDLKFDIIISRATASLSQLITWGKPLLKNQKKNNNFLLLKGGNLTNEIKESSTKPKVFPIYKTIPNDFFAQKYLLIL